MTFPTAFPRPEQLQVLADTPVESIDEVSGIYFRSVLLVKPGTYIPQHSHDHDHATLVAAGRARLWVDEQHQGDFEAGRAIEIRAGRKHLFLALEPNTRLVCVHDIASAESVKAREY